MHSAKNRITKPYMFSLFFLFMLSMLTVGLFYEWTSCIFCVFLIFWFLAFIKEKKEIHFKLNFTAFAIFLLCFAYLLSAIWAIDFGMAIIGFLKFFPVLLFLVCMMQLTDGSVLFKKYFPFFVFGMVLLSLLFMHLPFGKAYFSVAGRLAGFFQYPNTFAIVILTAELLLLSNKCKYYIKLPMIFGLLVGLLYTGSRTVMALGFIANLILFFYQSKKNKKMLLISFLLFFFFVIFALFLAFQRITPFDRVLSFTWKESTFIGRLLYYQDAFPIILKHPFGMGYEGYYYTQPSFQTGIYSVKYIHNDILQVALDVGILPAIIFVISIIKAMLNKGVSFTDRIIIGTLFFHLQLDFDLQFVSVFLLLIIFMNIGGTDRKVQMNIKLFVGEMLILATFFLYFSVALGLYSCGKFEIADHLFPANTDNKIQLLLQTDDINETEEIANDILKRNSYVSVAYSAKARAAYAKGDFATAIKYKKLVFEYAPFSYDEYQEYCYMLINGIILYNQAGYYEDATICQNELINTKDLYVNQLKKISNLGKMIIDQPKIQFSEDIEHYINSLREETNE